MSLRTTMLTAASVLGLLVLVGSAVGANLGILQSADRSPVGHLTIADLMPPPAGSGALTPETASTNPASTDVTTAAVPPTADSTRETEPLGPTPTSSTTVPRPVESSDDDHDADDVHDDETDSDDEHDDYDDD